MHTVSALAKMPRKMKTSFLPLLIFSALLGGLPIPAGGQIDSTQKAEWRFFPIAFANPQSGFGLGAGGLTTFYWGQDTSLRPSLLQSTASYTTKNQLLTYLGWDIFTGPQPYYFTGEAGYYHYSYRFHGLGNFTEYADYEIFQYRLIRFWSSYLRRLGDRPQYLGLRWNFDHWYRLQLAEGGKLAQRELPGTQGATTSSLGLLYQWDTREPVYFPTEGHFLRLALLHQGPYTGASYQNSRVALQFNYFQELPWGAILAGQWQSLHIGGPRVAYFDLGLIGGRRTLRGYYYGRFRGRHLQSYRVAYRQPLFNRWAAVLFGGAGRATETWKDLWPARFHTAGGLGIRYRPIPSSSLHIRFDLAWGDGPMQLYFGVGEAF